MRGTITYSSCAGNTESGFKHVTYSRVFPKYIIIMLSGDKRLYSSYIVVCLAELHTDTISTNLLTKYRANTHDVQNIHVCMYVYIYILAHMCIGEKITSPYTASHTHVCLQNVFNWHPPCDPLSNVHICMCCYCLFGGRMSLKSDVFHIIVGGTELYNLYNICNIIKKGGTDCSIERWTYSIFNTLCTVATPPNYAQWC